MIQRINYLEQSPNLAKKLFELSGVLAETALTPTERDLVDIRAAQIIGCAFCLDMHVKEAKIHGERELRIYHLPVWRESTLFSNRERAMLEWTEAVTKPTEHGISDEIYESVRKELSEKDISDLTYAIGAINMWTRLNISFRTVPGSFDAMLGLSKSGLK